MCEGRQTAHVWGPLSVRLTGCGAVGPSGWSVSGLLAGGRVWTHRVVLRVVDLGRLRGPGLGPFARAQCQGVAPARRLRSPYLCGWAWFPTR